MFGAFIALVAAALGTLSVGRVIQLFIDRGFSSKYFTSTEEGIDAFKQYSFCLVILDIWLNNSKLDEENQKLFLKNLQRIGYPYLKINNNINLNKFVIESFHRHHLPNMVKSKPNHTSLNKTIDLLKKTID